MSNNYEQTLQLFLEKLSGTLSPEEEKYVEKMRAEDVSFGKTWQKLEAESNAINTADFIGRINTEEDLTHIKQKINVQQKPVRKLNYFKRVSAVAAVLLLVVAGAYFAFFSKEKITDKTRIASVISEKKQSVNLKLASGKVLELNTDSAVKTITVDDAVLSTGNGVLQYDADDTTQNTLYVPPGERYKLVLSDGTQVWLNAATSLHFPFRFHGQLREVSVEGEAYFKVAKDSTHPFIVHTPLTQVQVLGTSFNVNTYEAGTVTTALVEGKVLAKSNDGKTTTLTPGYKATYELKSEFASDVFDEDEVMSWIKGTYYFHNITIANLAVVASRFYGINIVLNKEDLAGKSVTGVLEENKLADFLTDLETTAHIKFYYSGNELHLQ